MGVAVCVCVCYMYLCVCSYNRGPWLSAGEAADRDSEDFPGRPLARCTSEAACYDIFYTHVCSIRWEVLGVCGVVYQSLFFFLCVCVCVRTYLQIYFWLLPGSPSFIGESGEHVVNILYIDLHPLLWVTITSSILYTVSLRAEELTFIIISLYYKLAFSYNMAKSMRTPPFPDALLVGGCFLCLFWLVQILILQHTMIL